jgi:D-glycero-alpha-D-manno-heptose 1-phosphate guanylyltransferase
LNTAIILAGGLGTRLQSITKGAVPKPMVLVQGYPFLHWQMKYLKSQGIKKVIMAVSHQAEKVQDFFKEQYLSIPICYSVEKKPLGTGGGIAQAMQMSDDKTMVILNGDTYFPVALKKLYDEHIKSKNDITISIKLMHNFDRYGTVDLTKNNRIIAFNEKKFKEKGYINGGTYIVNKSVFKSFNPQLAFSIEKEIFEQKLNEIKIGAFKSKAKFIDIGIPEEYERIQTMILK